MPIRNARFFLSLNVGPHLDEMICWTSEFSTDTQNAPNCDAKRYKINHLCFFVDISMHCELLQIASTCHTVPVIGEADLTESNMARTFHPGTSKTFTLNLKIIDDKW